MNLAFEVAVALTALGVPLYAWRMRGRQYAIFAAIILAIALPGIVLMHGRYRVLVGPTLAPLLSALFAYATMATGLHLASLATARLRPTFFRAAVSIPAMIFVAAGALAGVWLLALLPVRLLLAWAGAVGALGVLAWLDLLPFAIAFVSGWTSSRPVEETVRVLRGTDGPPHVARVPVERYRTTRPMARRPAPLTTRPLRIVQISDTHLGPWQSVAQLRALIARLVAHDPDLVLLTGDFLTMESSGTPGALTDALTPLTRIPGRCYAIFGNHDHDHHSPAEVRSAMTANGVRLLMDEEAVVATPIGAVQIIGADYVGRGRREHIQGLLRAHPRRADHLRMLLLHDPLGFQHVPVGDVDLTLSGHTHGGQLGLVSFGLDWTVLAKTRWPDHGLFGHGPNRLYVHRGSGFYGFPLRIGVPGEASLLEFVVEPTPL